MIFQYRSVIVATTCRILAPFLHLYSLYVIMHGHTSPGGGFQGGVIMGASFILLVISLGREEALRRMTQKANDFFSSLGVFIYGGIGLACLLLGANYLDYGVLPFPGATPVKARYLGMLVIEIGIGISVMAIMVSIFLNLLGPETSSEEADGIHR
ncbi:MAG: MnhB domain-containing protein [Candidatus Binatia bacterium]